RARRNRRHRRGAATAGVASTAWLHPRDRDAPKSGKSERSRAHRGEIDDAPAYERSAIRHAANDRPFSGAHAQHGAKGVALVRTGHGVRVETLPTRRSAALI